MIKSASTLSVLLVAIFLGSSMAGCKKNLAAGAASDRYLRKAGAMLTAVAESGDAVMARDLPDISEREAVRIKTEEALRIYTEGFAEIRAIDRRGVFPEASAYLDLTLDLVLAQVTDLRDIMAIYVNGEQARVGEYAARLKALNARIASQPSFLKAKADEMNAAVLAKYGYDLRLPTHRQLW